MRKKSLHLHIDLGDWNLLIGERLPSGAIRIPSGWVINDRGRRAEVSAPEREGGDGHYIGASVMVATPLIIAEEKQLIANNAPTGGASELVVDQGWFACCKRLGGAKTCVFVEFKQAAVKLISPGTHRYIRYRPAR